VEEEVVVGPGESLQVVGVEVTLELAASALDALLTILEQYQPDSNREAIPG